MIAKKEHNFSAYHLFLVPIHLMARVFPMLSINMIFLSKILTCFYFSPQIIDSSQTPVVKAAAVLGIPVGNKHEKKSLDVHATWSEDVVFHKKRIAIAALPAPKKPSLRINIRNLQDLSKLSSVMSLLFQCLASFSNSSDYNWEEGGRDRANTARLAKNCCLVEEESATPPITKNSRYEDCHQSPNMNLSLFRQTSFSFYFFNDLILWLGMDLGAKVVSWE